MSVENFNFSLVSPEKVIFDGQVKMVTAPGVEGEFGILPDHAPFLSSLKEGVVSVVANNNEEVRIFVSGGFADVNDNICTILAENAVNVDDFDLDALNKEKDMLIEKLNMLADGEETTDSKDDLIRSVDIIDTKISLANS